MCPFNTVVSALTSLPLAKSRLFRNFCRGFVLTPASSEPKVTTGNPLFPLQEAASHAESADLWQLPAVYASHVYPVVVHPDSCIMAKRSFPFRIFPNPFVFMFINALLANAILSRKPIRVFPGALDNVLLKALIVFSFATHQFVAQKTRKPYPRRQNGHNVTPAPLEVSTPLEVRVASQIRTPPTVPPQTPFDFHHSRPVDFSLYYFVL